jgi:aspartyl protease family protein
MAIVRSIVMGLAAVMGCTYAWADTDINVVGLFTDKAVVVINQGRPQTLSAGQASREGVKLISASSASAIFEIEGKRKELAMGQAVTVAGSATASAGASQVTLYADPSGHFFTDGQVNGRTLRMLVDTGATALSMNSGDANYAGIDYKKGERVPMQTANGNVWAYRVTVNSLKLGGMMLNQVEGLIIEGGSPSVVLLGMSALNRMEMRRDGIALVLTKKY